MSGRPKALVGPRRVLSLLAGATELVCELGAGSLLVGRSHECDHPAWVRQLPAVSRPTFEITGSSADIDARVRERLSTGQPLYSVDAQLVAELAPDLILSQTHCDVCAVTPADLSRSSSPVCSHPVHALTASTIDGVLKDFLDVARVLGVVEKGQHLVERIWARLEWLKVRAQSLPHPTVVCLEWIDPVFPMSNWGPEVVALAGGAGLLGAPGRHSTMTPWQAVRQADPEVLVVAPCGFDVPRTLSEMPTLAARPGFKELRAVRSGRVYVADGNLYFNRSGPSLFETPELLAQILHPNVFAPTRCGAAWVQWPSA
jgi:iron complex transport system substrate-binding protein